MGGGEGRWKPIILNNGAASLGVTHGAHISHAQGVTGGSTTQVLQGVEQESRPRVRDSERKDLEWYRSQSPLNLSPAGSAATSQALPPKQLGGNTD